MKANAIFGVLAGWTLTASPQAGGWTPTKGIGWITGTDLVESEGRICAPSTDGIYCTTTTSDAWSRFALPGVRVSRLHKSGSSWFAIDPGPDSSSTNYYPSARVYFSADNGVTWRDRFFYGTLGAVSVEGENVIITNYYNSEHTYVYRSKDAGLTSDFDLFATFENCVYLIDDFICPRDGFIRPFKDGGSFGPWPVEGPFVDTQVRDGFFYGINAVGKLYKVSPDSIIWLADAGIPDGRIQYASDSLIVIAGDGHVRVSKGKPDDWITAPLSLFGLGPRKDGWFYLVSDTGVYRLKQAGEDVIKEHFNAAINYPRIGRLRATKDHLYLINAAGISRRGKGDVDWFPILRSASPIENFWAFDEVILTGGLSHPSLSATRDAGVTWYGRDTTRIPGAIRDVVKMGDLYLALSTIAIPEIERQRVAGTESNLWQTRDPTGTWTYRAALSKSEGRYPPNLTTALAAGNGSLFRLTVDTLYRSADSGISWSRIHLDANKIKSVRCAGDAVYAVDDAGTIHLSRDGGLAWSQVPNDTFFPQIITVTQDFGGALAIAEGNAYGSVNRRVAHLSDFSADERLAELELAPDNPVSLEFFDGKLWLGTENLGVFSLVLPEAPSRIRRIRRDEPRHGPRSRLSSWEVKPVEGRSPWRNLNGRAMDPAHDIGSLRFKGEGDPKIAEQWIFLKP